MGAAIKERALWQQDAGLVQGNGPWDTISGYYQHHFGSVCLILRKRDLSRFILEASNLFPRSMMKPVLWVIEGPGLGHIWCHPVVHGHSLALSGTMVTLGVLDGSLKANGRPTVWVLAGAPGQRPRIDSLGKQLGSEGTEFNLRIKPKPHLTGHALAVCLSLCETLGVLLQGVCVCVWLPAGSWDEEGRGTTGF